MVKAELMRDKSRQLVALAFECSKPEDHEILDAIRTAMLGSFEKSAGYINSNRLVVHIKVDAEEASKWE